MGEKQKKTAVIIGKCADCKLYVKLNDDLQARELAESQQLLDWRKLVSM